MKKTLKAVKKAAVKKTVKAAKKPAAGTAKTTARRTTVTKKSAAKAGNALKGKPVKKTARVSKGFSARGTKGAVRENPLLAELRAAASGLDADGIRQLIRQAAILKHNAKVLNEHQEKKKMATVDAIRRGTGVANKTTIDVKEADDGSSFIIIINNARNFFALDEMRKLVAICHAAEGESDGARRLYNWFAQHRKDVLVDTDIGSPVDQALVTMYRFIKGRYALKQG